MSEEEPTPTGKCFCGCGAAISTLFAVGHDKKVDAMLNKLKYGPDGSVAKRLVAEGYGPGGKNLFEEYEAARKRAAKAWAAK
ncbi:MAG: hypothetical protein OK454_02915 [Thaumarchaeota archaeon]|nr:hypothetical protein [Nitrososphaerota archaeon]